MFSEDHNLHLLIISGFGGGGGKGFGGSGPGIGGGGKFYAYIKTRKFHITSK